MLLQIYRSKQRASGFLMKPTLALLLFHYYRVYALASSILPQLAGMTLEPTKSYNQNHIIQSTVERPYFDDIGSRNVTAIVGQSITLRCRVKHRGERTVSWIRKRDLHILTSNIFTYTGDARFSVHHPEHSDDWDLRIEYVQKRDAGIYECQVNTEPKLNLATMLNVEDAQANIWGSEETYVKKGSTISLTCSVNIQSQPPSSVLWYHDHSIVDFDSPRGGISLETEKTETGTISKLLVTKAALTDGGNYTCVPSNAHPASVYVHVLNGEHPAAMQTTGSTTTVSASTAVLLYSACMSILARQLITVR